MATGMVRDLDQTGALLAAWLAAHPGAAGHPDDPAGVEVIVDVARAAHGWSNETLLLNVRPDARAGPARSIVVRMPPVEPCFPEYDLAMQAAVQQELAGHGIPAPAPAAYEGDTSWVGCPFMVMPFVEGRVPGQAPALDEWVNGLPAHRQRGLHDAFIDHLAWLHRLDWRGWEVRHRLRGVGTGLEAELEWWARYLVWASGGQPDPLLVEALERCRRNRPATEPEASLCWGDARLGNLVVGEEAEIRAMLDWEMAMVGPAEMDLGWYLGLEWLTGELLGSGVAGFPTRDEAVDRYARRLGRPVADYEWYEAFALFRSMAVADKLARLSAPGGEADAATGGMRDPMAELVAGRIAGLDSSG